MIFATTENVYQTFLPTFIRRLPVIVMLPNYERRPQSERMQLIDTFLSMKRIFCQNASM